MSFVLGIDLSSHAVDLVTLDETTNHGIWTRIALRSPIPTAFERLRQVQFGMPPASFYDDVYLAAIERPKTRSFISASALWPVFGAVVACLPWRLEVWDVAPTEWRKELGLKGNASKEECAAAVRRTIWHDDPTEDWPQDALDAYAIAYYARETNRRANQAA